MKGDFSSFRYDPRRNDQGVLFQQGRVTLDADLTDAELIAQHWREQAARDVIGSGVAAVPVRDSAGFHVDSAQVEGTAVELRLDPGRCWADGILLYLPGDPANPTASVRRTADYFPAPINPAGTSVGSIDDGVRDAVVLEVVLEELNAFQEPDRLLEAALGGPDTAERITPRFRLGLVRLGANEDCTSIAGRLADPPAGLGKLSVSLEPPQLITDQDCPTVAGGGYTGFEHNLYRIEIAAANTGAPRFKWSQFNGSLVGRGVFMAGAPKTVTITANRAAIISSGLTDFYLEALAFDNARGLWSVVYGTAATLNSDSDLELADPPTFGTFTFGTDSVFFRLWNGIENVGDYDDAAPISFRDGIELQFDPTATATYRAGDYWTFPVRARERSSIRMFWSTTPCPTAQSIIASRSPRSSGPGRGTRWRAARSRIAGAASVRSPISASAVRSSSATASARSATSTRSRKPPSTCRRRVVSCVCCRGGTSRI